MSTPHVRVRIAPSPTGYFHVGNARTALFNWLYAAQQDGDFVWRVEDTDRQRLVEAALEDTRESLHWLGIDPTEGPYTGGEYGPYHQSERLDLYEVHAAQLVSSGHAYRCFCSPERLASLREHRSDPGHGPVYDRRCRELTRQEADERANRGEPSVLRLKIPLGETIQVNDRIRGEIAFETDELEDVILVKSDGYPTYHFAVVVDDHHMAITHVLRADEWISSVPYQIVLYDALGWPAPIWAHVPMVLNPDGRGKLSKRKTVDEAGQPIQQMTQIREFRAAGYLPEAMFNYLALQGWSYSGDTDVFTREQAIERFRLEDVRPAPSAWDPEKLDWMNGVYIRQLAPDDLAARLMPFLAEAGIAAELEVLTRVAPLIQERLTTLADAAPWVRSFFHDVSPAPDELVPKKLDREATRAVLAAAHESLSHIDDWRTAEIESALREVAAELGHKPGPVFQPVRVATSGTRVSPPLPESLEILGPEVTLARLESARMILEAPS